MTARARRKHEDGFESRMRRPLAKRSLGALRELEAGARSYEARKGGVLTTTFEYQENMSVTAVYEAKQLAAHEE